MPFYNLLIVSHLSLQDMFSAQLCRVLKNNIFPVLRLQKDDSLDASLGVPKCYCNINNESNNYGSVQITKMCRLNHI